MGNTFCTRIPGSTSETKKYLDDLTSITDRYRGVTGGSGDEFKFGGYNSLENYGNSMFSKAKEELIRSIAKDIATVLKISPSFAEKADLKDVISKFTKVVPNPRQGRKIKVSKKIHDDVCKKIANSINKNYKTDLINVDSSAEYMCREISEVLYSLFTGIHTEFLTVAADVSRIMDNLNKLQTYIDGIHNKLIKDLSAHEDSESQQIREAYEAISREIRRQHTYLTNLSTGVIGPTGKSIIHLIEENDEFSGLTKDLETMSGSREFSDKLSYMMSGTSSVAHAAYLVDKALKELGLSLSEYKKSKDIRSTRKLVYDKLVKLKPSSKNITKLLAAAEVLYRNDLSHDDIVTHLSKKGGDTFAELVSDGLYKDKGGVYEGRKYANKGSITTQIHNKKVLKRKLLSGLNSEIRRSYTVVINDLSKISKGLNSGNVKNSDQMHRFVRQMGYLVALQPDRNDLVKALSGVNTNALSKYVKEDFINSLNAVISVSEELSSGSLGQQFKEITSSLKSLVGVIENFNNTFTKSLTEISVSSGKKSGGYGDGYGAGMVALAEMEAMAYRGGSSDFKYVSTLNKAVRELEYYFKISNIKKQLSSSNSTSTEYKKNYENIIGEECGLMIDKINKLSKALVCEDKTVAARMGSTLTSNAPVMRTDDYINCKPYGAFVTGIGTPAQKDKQRAEWAAYKFTIEYIRSAKVEMIEAAQALDLYLSKFAEHVQTNPDAIKDYVKLLEQLEVVSKWFTEKSGDNLVRVFENHQRTSANSLSIDGSNDHYYKVMGPNGDPMKVEDGIMLVETAAPYGNKVKDLVIDMEKSLKSMRALENIISIFSKINIGNEKIQTFMSKGLMFKVFMKYTVATSLSIGCWRRDVNPANVNITYSDVVRNFGAAPWPTDINAMGVGGGMGRVYLRKVDAHNVYHDTANRQKFFDPLELNDGDAMLSTDEIFEMCIKSMISKIFVVVGSFNLFNKPSKSYKSNNALSNSALRQIMGGSEHVRIIPEATEAYIRLVLLAEWYSDVFTQLNPVGMLGTDFSVNMLPQFDGIWYDFTKVMFIDAANVSDGGYPNSLIQDIIQSINKIYKHYKAKHPTTIVTEIINAFVSEVNMRYGLIMKEQFNEYERERDTVDNNSPAGFNELYNDDDDVDYDILDSELSDTRLIAPSDKFRKESARPNGSSSLKTKRIHEKIKEFRRTVETSLKLQQGSIPSPGADEGVFGAISMKYSSVDDLIMQTKKRLAAIGSDNAEKQYGVVQSMLMGVERYSDVDYDTMLMFHETVINPLTILYTVYKMLNTWNRFANSLNMTQFFYSDGSAKTTIGFGLMRQNYIAGMSKANSKYLRPSNVNYGFVTTYAYFNVDDYKRYCDDPMPTGAGSSDIAISNLFKDTIVQLQYLVADKNPLVELYYSGDGKEQYPMLNFKKIEEHCTVLMANTKLSINKFRKVLPHSIISRYEKMNHDNDALGNMTLDNKKPNVVSTSYLQEHLFDRLFKNRYRGGLSDSNASLKTIWQYCTKQVDVNLTPVIKDLVMWQEENANANHFQQRILVNDLENWTKFPIYAVGLSKQSSLSEMRATKGVVEDIVQKNGTTSSHKPSDLIFNNTNTQAIRFNIIDAATNAPPAGPNWSGEAHILDYMGFQGIYDGYLDTTQAAGVRPLLSESEGISSGRGAQGLIVKFNRILYNYITTFTDVSSSKIYLPLLEGFANGINSDEIMKGNAINDLNHNSTTAHMPAFLDRYSKETNVIFATLARGVRNIVTMKKKMGTITVLEMAEESLLNVSSYMKDTMTAYLPMFSKQLNIMMSMANMYRSMIEKTKFPIMLELDPANQIAGKIGLHAPLIRPIPKVPVANWQTDTNFKPHQSKGKNYFVTQLDFIVASCKSLQQCCDKVYKELADVPLYFETYKNSLADYENRNGILPLMPLSHTSHLLNNAVRIVGGPNSDLVTPTPTVMGGAVVGGYTREQLKKVLSKKVKEAKMMIKIYRFQRRINDENPTQSGLKIEYDTYMRMYKSFKIITFIKKIVDEEDHTKIINLMKARHNEAKEAQKEFNKIAEQSTISFDDYHRYKKLVSIMEAVKEIENIGLGLLNDLKHVNKYNDLFERNTENENMIREYNYTIEELDKVNKTIENELKTSEDDINTLMTALLSTENELKTSEDDIDTLRTALLSTENELKTSEDDVDTLRTAFLSTENELKTSEDDVDTLRTALLSTVNEISDLEKKVKDGENCETEKKNLIEKVNELTKQVNQLTVRLNSEKTSNISLTKQLANVTTQLANVTTQLANVNTQLGVANTQLGVANAQLAAANVRLRSAYIVNNNVHPPNATNNNAPIGQNGIKLNVKYSPTFGLPHADNGAGSPSFKFAYGTRGLLSDTVKPSVDLAPGVLGMLDLYNKKVGGAVNYDKKRLTDIFEHSTYLLRWATDYTYHKTYLGDNDLNKLTEYFIISSPNVTGHRNILQHVSCQTAKHAIDMNASLSAAGGGIRACCDQFFIKTSNITNLIENDNYKHSLYRMLRCIVDNDKAQNLWGFNRNNLRIYNILDANIVPFNFHTLQSEVPLINIFNYSYTFDHLIKEKFGVKYKHLTDDHINKAISLDWSGPTPTATNPALDISLVPEDTIIRIMMNPSGKRYLYDYRNNVSRIMAGSTGWPLNRPKYLSDQLWNKVLLNVIYRNNERYGPGALQGFDRDTPQNGIGAYAEDTLLQQARTMGFNNVVGKPYDQTKEPLESGFALLNPAANITDEINNFAFNVDNQPHTYVKSVKGSRMKIETVVSGANPHSLDKLMSRLWLKEGYHRYNTCFVRYIEWFVHLQRSVRLLMRENLSSVTDPISHKQDALDNEVTDYKDNNKFTVTDFE